jgi:monoterpene epsilon-lactone hydrolase
VPKNQQVPNTPVSPSALLFIILFLPSQLIAYAQGKMKEADHSELKFKKFPPVLLLVGTDEILNDDSKKFYAVVKPIQKQAKLKEFNGQKHV